MIGCDVTSPVRDVVVDSCVIKDTHRGLGVRLSLEGSMEHILFSNIIVDTRMYDDRWWGRGEPIAISAVRWNSQRNVGIVRDIHFSNILCRGENGVMVYAEEPGKLDGIEFDRVQVHIDKTTKLPAGHQDLRPKPTDQMPEFPTSGFMLRNAANVTLRNCSVTWGDHRDPAYHSVLDAEHCPNLAADGLTGEAADPAALSGQKRSLKYGPIVVTPEPCLGFRLSGTIIHLVGCSPSTVVMSGSIRNFSSLSG